MRPGRSGNAPRSFRAALARGTRIGDRKSAWRLRSRRGVGTSIVGPHHSVAWRSARKREPDPWLCVPSLQMVCLCRGCTIDRANPLPFCSNGDELRTGIPRGDQQARERRTDGKRAAPRPNLSKFSVSRVLRAVKSRRCVFFLFFFASRRLGGFLSASARLGRRRGNHGRGGRHFHRAALGILQGDFKEPLLAANGRLVRLLVHTPIRAVG